MCYVHNQWYDISCATLYDYSLFRVRSFTNFNALVNFVILSLIKDLRVHKTGA